jgi:hypothetical protein
MTCARPPCSSIFLGASRPLPLSNCKRPTAGVARRSAVGFEKHDAGAGRTLAVGSPGQPDLCSFAAFALIGSYAH